MRANGAAPVNGLSGSAGGAVADRSAGATRSRSTSRRADRPDRALAWAELLRLPALFTVPGDALAGAAAASVRPGPRTLLAIASSLCLYEAGMALNDWADRDEDAVERPHRPLPSGRVHPTAAFAAACALTGTGLSLAACAGRPALAVALPLAGTVWAYDLALKNTPAGPFAMATARGLDLLLGAAASGAGGHRNAEGAAVRGGGTEVTRAAVGPRTGDRTRQAVPFAAPDLRAGDRIRRALPSAALLSTHTLAVTTVSRRETSGGSPLAPLAALAATGLLARLLTHRPAGPDTTTSMASDTLVPTASDTPVPTAPGPIPPTEPSPAPPPTATPAPHTRRLTDTALRAALTATYAATTARPYFHAALNPSPPLTQRAVTAGIRATIPLQAALAARSGATVTALLTTALAPLARRFARKVSVT